MATYRRYFTINSLKKECGFSYDLDHNRYVIDIIFWYNNDTVMKVVTKEVLNILKPYLYEENYDLRYYEYKLEACSKLELEDLIYNLIKQIKKLKEDY